MSELDADPEQVIADLEAAISEYQTAQAAVETVGREQLEALSDAYTDLLELLREFEGKATGTGREEFVNAAQFRASVVDFVDELDDELPDRERFEAARDAVDKRRLSESNFERAREALSPVQEDVDRLDRLETAAEQLRTAYETGEETIEQLEEAIARQERLLELGEADLDAPIQELRDPVDRYNERVETAFEQLRSERSTRELFALLEETEQYPLIDIEQPPAEIRDYVAAHAAGEEPLTQLLEYAEYSRSKLAHYVDDPDLLKRKIATQRVALERIDAAPFTIDWPPPEADRVPWLTRELRGAASQLLDEDALAGLRDLEALARDANRYERLRTAAEAAAELTESDRQRLESGAVGETLSEYREQRDRIAELVDEAKTRLYRE
jgi:exonuclease VII small subunit